MTELYTILRVVFALGYYETTLPSEMACGALLPAVHDLALAATDDQFGTYLFSACIPTGAPSRVGTRPWARGAGV